MSPKVLRLPLRSAREYPDKMVPLKRVQRLRQGEKAVALCRRARRCTGHHFRNGDWARITQRGDRSRIQQRYWVGAIVSQ
jgi:hypothetical protein